MTFLINRVLIILVYEDVVKRAFAISPFTVPLEGGQGPREPA